MHRILSLNLVSLLIPQFHSHRDFKCIALLKSLSNHSPLSQDVKPLGRIHNSFNFFPHFNVADLWHKDSLRENAHNINQGDCRRLWIRRIQFQILGGGSNLGPHFIFYFQILSNGMTPGKSLNLCQAFVSLCKKERICVLFTSLVSLWE